MAQDNTLDLLGRNGQLITQSIAANGTHQIFVAGTNFYLNVATAKLRIKPLGSQESEFVQGEGLNVTFKALEIRNPNPYPVVFSLWAGYGAYIDNKTILYNPNVKEVVFPTYPVPVAANTIDIIDYSGQQITDINGKVWLALGRSGIYVSNIDLAVDIVIESGTVPGAGALVTFPRTATVFPVSGDYKIRQGSPVNGYISETYQAIEPTL